VSERYVGTSQKCLEIYQTGPDLYRMSGHVSDMSRHVSEVSGLECHIEGLRSLSPVQGQRRMRFLSSGRLLSPSPGGSPPEVVQTVMFLLSSSQGNSTRFWNCVLNSITAICSAWDLWSAASGVCTGLSYTLKGIVLVASHPGFHDFCRAWFLSGGCEVQRSMELWQRYPSHKFQLDLVIRTNREVAQYTLICLEGLTQRRCLRRWATRQAHSHDQLVLFFLIAHACVYHQQEALLARHWERSFQLFRRLRSSLFISWLVWGPLLCARLTPIWIGRLLSLLCLLQLGMGFASICDPLKCSTL